MPAATVQLLCAYHCDLACRKPLQIGTKACEVQARADVWIVGSGDGGLNGVSLATALHLVAEMGPQSLDWVAHEIEQPCVGHGPVHPVRARLGEPRIGIGGGRLSREQTPM